MSDITSTKGRNFGLDLMRFTAIILVVLHHWISINLTIYPPAEKYAYYFSLFGYLGVEIFFVLSGFLIGNIITKAYLNSAYDFKSVGVFWARRWMRTLPLYYFMLAVNIIYALYKHNSLAYLWKYFFFVQNLFGYITTNKNFFGESWSLSIEEWFYISFPILLIIFNLILNKKFSKKVILRSTVLFYILIPTVVRFVLVFIRDPSWNDVLRKAVICREDSIAYGLLGAYLHNTYTKTISPHFKNYLVFFGGVLIVFCCAVFCTDIVDDYSFNTGNVSAFSKTILFSIVSFAVLLTVPFFYTLKVKKNYTTTAITFISKISYSLYLTHLFVERGVHKAIQGNDLKSLILRFILFLSISIIISSLTFKYIENTFLLIRDRIWREKYKPT